MQRHKRTFGHVFPAKMGAQANLSLLWAHMGGKKQDSIVQYDSRHLNCNVRKSASNNDSSIRRV